jgi:hypothetical protein
MKEGAKTVKANAARPDPNAAGSQTSLCDRREAAIRSQLTEPVDLLLEDLSSGNADIVAANFCDDPTIPPPGRRSGSGSSTILPYLVRTLAAKPRDAIEPLPAANDAASLASSVGVTRRSPRD